MKIALLDIGGTELKAALLQEGEAVQRYLLNKAEQAPAVWHLQAHLNKQLELLEPAEPILSLAHEGALAMLNRAKALLQRFGPVDALGISTAGQVDASRGLIRYANPNIPHYTGCDLRAFFGQAFSCPVAVENDVNAAALGELHFGVGARAGLDSFLCLTLGTGIGGAIVEEGHLRRGVYGSAGEFGTIITHAEARLAALKEGPLRDEMAGCFERYASTAALVSLAQAVDPSIQNGRQVFAQIERPEIRAVIDSWIEELVIGLLSLAHCFNPQYMVLGGGVSCQNYVVEKANELLNQQLSSGFKPLYLKQAQLGSRAGLWGAAYSAVQYLSK